VEAYGLGGFERAGAQFAAMVAVLGGSRGVGWSHARVEEFVLVQGRELQRLLIQEHLDVRAAAEVRVGQVVGGDGVARRSAERGHRRGLLTVFGPVGVERIAYRGPGVVNLCPADAVLNLPAERHSHGVRKVAAVEAVRGSYADAHAALGRSCGISVGKRQLELLTQRAAVDVDAFYAQRRPGPVPDTELLVLSVDGKGVVMRPEALRDNTKRKGVSDGLCNKILLS
jgi:hypothetical protein